MTVTQNKAANNPQKIIADLQRKLDERTAERDEALERETATADVLKIISRSFDLQSVLATLVETVARLCDAEMAFILRRDGEVYRAGAAVGFSREYMEFLQCHPISTDRGTVTGRVALEGRIVQIADVTADPEYTLTEAGTLTGQRTALGVPLFRGEEVIGVIVLARRRIGLFTERQIELVATFANQAVIAIENARLFNETKEALDRQTATAEILRVISRSPTDARPVFESIVLTALPLLRCESVFVMLCDDKTFFTAAAVTPDGLVSDVGRTRLPIDPDANFPSRAIIERKTLYLPDWSLLDLPEHERKVRERLHIDSSLYLPLLREEACVGLLALVGKRANSFGPSEIAQAESFRDQALIAMENARLFTETKEALERQTATAEILKVIASSHSDVQPVLETIAESTMRLLNGWSVLVTLFDGEQLHFGAARGAVPDTEQYLRGLYPARVGSATGSHRAILERRPVNIPDAPADPSPQQRENARTRGYRAALAVPMIHNGQSIGVIAASRREPGAFADAEVAVLQTFADQAVIAIENVRLFNETKAALQQQTATADVLKVISRSAFDLQTVLGTLVESARTLCDAPQCMILLRDDEVLRVAKQVGYSDEWERWIRDHPLRINRDSATGRALLTAEAVHIPDIFKDPEYQLSESQRLGGYRALLAVPLLRDHDAEGTIVLSRSTPVPFTQRQIDLVRTFADQAVIAIENTRLFEEVQARTRDLEESLRHQTATSDVLKVISRSAFGLNEVFQMLIDSAVRLCADDGVVYLRHGDIFLAEAAFDADAEKIKARNLTPRRLGRGSLSGRVALSGAVEQIPDILADAEFEVAPAQRLSAMRALLGVPLLREGRVDGVFVLGRREPGHFGERAVELATTFADQAVIAIENVHLLNQLKAKTGDLEESLDQQTATAEVLKVISESVFELQPVFDTMAENAVRLCKAERALIFRFDGSLLRAVASHNVGPELWQFIDRNPIAPGRQSISARAALYRRTVQVTDVQSDPDYSYAARDVDLIRTIVAVPMLKGDQLVGTITIYKLEAKPFTDKQIMLVETFAEQAVIAIENARLFEEVQARTRDLSQSLDDLRTAQDRLVQTEKLASLGQLTAGIAHEIKNPLNFVNNFADLSGELLQELKETASPALTALDNEKRAEIDEIMGMLDLNLRKIAEHGRRADGIVKSMLAHSRGGSSERRAVDLNNLVDEALNLAYHGARAQDQSFNITLERAFDADLAPIELVPQDVTRVLLNLIGNGFYAANKRSRGAGSRPVLTVSTRDLGTAVEIRVRDNGIGIAPIYRDKLFQPFFTTKPTGEGTGLGLSISYDIVTQQHGGTIEVDSEPDAFTEFTVRLPRGRHIATGGACER